MRYPTGAIAEMGEARGCVRNRSRQVRVDQYLLSYDKYAARQTISPDRRHTQMDAQINDGLRS